MEQLKKPRGFPDKRAEESLRLDFLLSVIVKVFKSFAFQKVETPILEYSGLFSRTLGRDSDIVNKEMYSFQKGEENFTLRPEGTASIARMFITEKLYKSLPVSWYYIGPMFRHERPQKGRFRQFCQAGAECLGDSHVQKDAEILSLAWALIKALGLEKKAALEINSLGSLEERKQYREKLKKYLQAFKSKLSADSLKRLEKNPLRIWDSKEKSDQEIMRQAPLLQETLKKQSLERHEQIKELLNFLNIPFKENPKLVRGLDYYNDLVFECVSGDLGAQSAFLAGGRYDHLIESLGGPKTPAAGWALGLERLSLLCSSFPEEKPMRLGLAAIGSSAQKEAFKLAYELRSEGFSLFYRFSGNFSKQMKRISQKCLWALIYGEKEREKGEIILKELKTGEQKSLSFSNLRAELKKLFQN